MLSNAYLLAKIGADTAENEQRFAENEQRFDAVALERAGRGAVPAGGAEGRGRDARGEQRAGASRVAAAGSAGHFSSACLRPSNTPRYTAIPNW